MRTKLIFATATLAVIIGLVLINACSKGDQELVINKGNISNFSPNEQAVIPLITKFNERYKNFNYGLKSGVADIKLGEAIWTLEAAANYEFQGVKEELGNIKSNNFTKNLEVYLGEDFEFYITEANVMNLYTEMLIFTNNQIVSAEEELLTADLEIVSVENGIAELMFETLVGQDPYLDCSVNSTDYWKAANGAGKCYPYSGQYIGKDAADRINILLNCILISAGYWTDVENTDDITTYYDNNSNPCFWGQGDPGYYYTCLDPQGISYWKVQAQFVINDIKPTGKEFINCSFKDSFWVGYGQIYFHYFDNIKYGIPHNGGHQ